jgi:hypothetical protein
MRHLPALVLLGGALACSSEPVSNPVKEAFAREKPTSSFGTEVAFRFAAQQGRGVRVYNLPAMEEFNWRFENPDLVAYEVVGFAEDEGQVYIHTPDSQLIALELATGRQQMIDSGIVAAAFGPTGQAYTTRANGTIGAVSDRRVSEWPDTLSTIPTNVWGTTGGRLVAIEPSGAGRRVNLLADGQSESVDLLPDGHTATAPWGDLIVVAADSGLVAVEPENSSARMFLRLRSRAVAVAVSPPGHRVVAATEAAELIVVDRFRFRVLSRRPLPRMVTAIRYDPYGRYLLLRPADADSVWIVDIATPSDSLRIHAASASWDRDLPVVTPNGTALVRSGQDVVAIDPDTGGELGRVTDGADGRWLVVRWDPHRPSLQMLAEQIPTPSSTGELYFVQVSATYNEAWATDLATNLRQAGLDAQVLTPTPGDDRYRVVLGPYPTRREADELGRTLGQAYFIFSRDTTSTIP